MKTRRREFAPVSISFLDVISCGFGAIVLLLLIAKIADPAALEQAQRQITASFEQLREQLFEIRGETVVLNRELKSRQEQLSELKKKIARLQDQLASVSRQQKSETQSYSREKAELQLALQVLTEEMERLLGSDFRSQNQLIGGIPVDSEYVIFVIDTSGSMVSAAWDRLKQEVVNILDLYPRVKGIQVMNDMGNYMFSSYAGKWMPDTPKMRQDIIRTLNVWTPFSNSSPVEGIQKAISTFYSPDRKISIYVLGDDFTGNSIRRVADMVEHVNRNRLSGEKLVRIHAIGFPVLYMQGEPTASAVRFAALMRELSYQNGGTFVALNSLSVER